MQYMTDESRVSLHSSQAPGEVSHEPAQARSDLNSYGGDGDRSVCDALDDSSPGAAETAQGATRRSLDFGLHRGHVQRWHQAPGIRRAQCEGSADSRFDIDIEHCPSCGGAPKTIATIEAPAVIVREKGGLDSMRQQSGRRRAVHVNADGTEPDRFTVRPPRRRDHRPILDTGSYRKLLFQPCEPSA